MSVVDSFGNITLSGTDAGEGSTNFTSNILIGLSAGVSMSGATLNTVIGDGAAAFLTTQDPAADCSHNTAVGEYTVYGAYNTRNHTVLGTAAGQEIIYGDANILVGYAAGFKGIVVSNNTFIGNEAGMYQNNAANNVFVGYGAGYRTGSAPPSYMYRNVGIGDGVFRNTVSGYNSIAIGVESVVNVSSIRETIVLGTGSAVNTRSLCNSMMFGNRLNPSNVSGSIILATRPLPLVNVSDKLYINSLITGDFSAGQVFVNTLPITASGTLVVNGDINALGEVYAFAEPLYANILSLSGTVSNLSAYVYTLSFNPATITSLSSNFWNLSAYTYPAISNLSGQFSNLSAYTYPAISNLSGQFSNLSAYTYPAITALSSNVSNVTALLTPAPFLLYTVSGTTSSNAIELLTSSSSATTAVSIAGHHCKLYGDYNQVDQPMTNVFAFISGAYWWVHGEITGSIPASAQTWNFNLLQMNQTLCTVSGAFSKYT